MATRHFINDGTTLVQDALQGLALTHPSLIYDPDNKSIVNSRHDGNAKVTLISGGGAGHEPSFAGLVGDGLLSAAVSGSVFASPSVHQIQNAIASAGGSAGTLLIIMNYTGDVLHFHLAAEKARLAGHEMAVLVVGDDVSVGRRKSGKVGRRGLAGTVLVEKILGAVAQYERATLKELYQLGEGVVANLATVGAALDHVHLVGKPTTDLTVRTDQVEVGMGIHNEPGCYVLKPQPDINILVDQMLDQLLDQEDKDRAYVRFDDADDLVLMVNNLGGVSNLEFSAVTKVVIARLGERNLHPRRVYAGAYMTSLDGKGFSITLLKASKAMIQALDAPASSPGWTAHQHLETSPVARKSSAAPDEKAKRLDSGSSRLKVDNRSLSAAITRACHKLVAAEEEIDRFDSLVGDGDCGSTLARTARAMLADMEKGGCVPPDGDVVGSVEAIAKVVENNMDGTSGALYAIFLNAVGASLRDAGDKLQEERLVGAAEWSEACVAGLDALQRATPARVGDRTLMDALDPFIRALQAGESTEAALLAAESGRDRTQGMRASLGRAVYVPEQGWSEVPDPGAAGLVVLLKGLLLA
ncbi:dihydroxyacetone kinase [Aspergillus aculeatinus CBS 121060]|uniref:Dihydroxyacetone kinase n=1 Tax=Aspergillus aculeatinus CBS 121060 TaxID=1448322 RepID=A0ACD1H211_9EURO|nr:dihydroxyacetone kinase [Aspergillus aculeatinus CBS 121060]RAH67461.1 dihydroxyacetone kinase [Aspergillus aculeatinus CBS 121060]